MRRIGDVLCNCSTGTSTATPATSIFVRHGDVYCGVYCSTCWRRLQYCALIGHIYSNVHIVPRHGDVNCRTELATSTYIAALAGSVHCLARPTGDVKYSTGDVHCTAAHGDVRFSTGDVHCRSERRRPPQHWRRSLQHRRYDFVHMSNTGEHTCIALLLDGDDTSLSEHRPGNVDCISTRYMYARSVHYIKFARHQFSSTYIYTLHYNIMLHGSSG
jgi:hypothetical protein